MHGCPEIAAPLLVEDFCGVWQPIEIFAGETELHFAPERMALNRDCAFEAKFPFLLNLDVLDIDRRIAPGKAHRTVVQVQAFECFLPRELGKLFEKREIIDARVTQT